MRTIKSLAPVLILIAGAYYAYPLYDRLPVSVLQQIEIVPLLLAILVIGLTIYFNRSAVYFYTLVVIIANLLPGLKWAETELSYALLAGLIPLQLLILTLLPERGIISIRSIPAYVSMLLIGAFAFYLVEYSPAWATQALFTDWLPARYFDWTQLPQTVLAISIAVFLFMLTLFFVRPSPHLCAGLGVLVMLVVQMHAGNGSSSLSVFGTAALLMCLIAVIQESWSMAYLDELTGLPARRALREKFQQISGLYTVAMLDVDHFKKFNDTYGHDTGDAVLKMIAGKMNNLTGGGLPYRYGGEEFSIVFRRKSAKDARLHLEALRETIASSPFVINRGSRRKSDKKVKRKKNESVAVTVSIGIADSNADVSSPWDVLKLSDKALYKAKGRGRNCVLGWT
jgi:diguanylate cyclase (GGDEF)-like protein